MHFEVPRNRQRNLPPFHAILLFQSYPKNSFYDIENAESDEKNKTIQQKPSSDEVHCASCLTKISTHDSTEVQDSLKSWFETTEKAGNPNGVMDKFQMYVLILRGIS